MHTKERTLKKIIHHGQMIISLDFQRLNTNETVLDMVTEFWGRQDKNVAIWDVPLTPWQFFKALYMPLWFRNKYPIRYQTLTALVEVVNHDVQTERFLEAIVMPLTYITKEVPTSDIAIETHRCEAFIWPDKVWSTWPPKR